MIRGMTGFGRSSGSIGSGLSFTVTIRTVNHRYLEMSIRLPESLWELEATTRALVAGRLTKGKVDVAVRAKLREGTGGHLRVNRSAAESLLADLQRMAEDLGLGPVGLRELLSAPGIIDAAPEDEDLDERSREEFGDVVREALEQVEVMRAKEGEGLRNEIESRLDRLDALRETLADERAGIIAEALESYRHRVDEIASQAGVDVDRDRIAQETVLQVERGDIAEELARLEIHLRQVRDLLDVVEPAGKKLDFLSQELLREVNTIGSKSRATSVRTLVVELKSEIERIREQVQNVE